MKPMSDLCWVCQQNSVAIMRAANSPEALKSEVRITKKMSKLLDSDTTDSDEGTSSLGCSCESSQLLPGADR